MMTAREALALGWQSQQDGDLATAEQVYQKVLLADSGLPMAWRLLADLRVRQHRLAESIPLYQQALRLKPDLPEGHYNLGNTYFRLGRLIEAETCYRQALAQQPDHAQALNNLGVTLAEQSRYDEAGACYRQATRLLPGYAEAYLNLANACKNQGRLDEALACYRRCVALQPDNPVFHSYLLYALHFHPDLSPQTIFEEHQQWARQHALPIAGLPFPFLGERTADRQLRIGYVSSDFRTHVMGHYSEAVLRVHDREAFEVFCYASIAWPDDQTRRIESLADGWRSVAELSDAQAAELIHRDRIDILVDLVGHTGGNRLLIFARRPAPIQVTHFGYQATTGLPQMDYRLTDAWSDPPGMTERYHSEQLVRLPELLWCYPPPPSPEVNPLPALRNGSITFGSFNGLAKITAQVIALWARILTLLPDARLTILTGAGRQADERILDAFALNGIPARRLLLREKAPRSAYFQMFHDVDICLDPFPCVGCNTTADALWMGVPVVSLAGTTCFSRQSVGLLNAVGLADLVATTPEAYVEAAVGLARDLGRLGELRASLRERMRKSPLTNVQRFTQHLEDAYRTMWKTWCADHAVSGL